MYHIPIPSESCPECGVKGKECRLVISEVMSLRDFSVKTAEEDFRAEFNGLRSPKYREAYLAHRFICLNKERSQ